MPGGAGLCGWKMRRPPCVPECNGKACGPDGCGDVCGICPDGLVCSENGGCFPPECEPDCEGKDCGDDGCGGVCGVCELGLTCLDDRCVSPLPAFRIAKTFNVGMTAAAESVGIARKTGSASRGPADWFVKPSAWRKNAVLTGVAESAGPVPSERNAAHSFSAKRWDVRPSAGIRNAAPTGVGASAGSAPGTVFA